MKNFIIKQKRILLYCLSFALSALFLISSIFVGSSTLVSADSNLSVKDVASKVKVEVADIIYYENQSERPGYVGSMHIVSGINQSYYVSDYQYFFLVMVNEDYESIKNDSYSCDDYMEKLDELNIPYFFNVYELGKGCYKANDYYYFLFSLNMLNSEETPEEFEKKLNKEYVYFMVVKDTTTNESVFSEPFVFSYNSLNENDTLSTYYRELYEKAIEEIYYLNDELDDYKSTNTISKSEYDKLNTENTNLKKEIEELKKNSKNNNIDFTKIISIVGVALLGFGFLCFLIDLSKRKKNRK